MSEKARDGQGRWRSKTIAFGDFQMYSGYAIVALHTSTIGQGHERHGRLKTRNGYRMVVFGEKASRIILSRKERIETALKIGKINIQYGAMSAISVAPMVARIDNPMVPYSSIQISNSYRALLRDVGYDNRDYQAAVRIVGSEDFTEAERKANPEELGLLKLRILQFISIDVSSVRICILWDARPKSGNMPWVIGLKILQSIDEHSAMRIC